MADKRGRKFGEPADYEAFRVDGADLYWNGKKLSTVGWTRAERLTVIGIGVAACIALATAFLGNSDKWETAICGIHQFPFCSLPPSSTDKQNLALPSDTATHP